MLIGVDSPVLGRQIRNTYSQAAVHLSCVEFINSQIGCAESQYLLHSCSVRYTPIEALASPPASTMMVGHGPLKLVDDEQATTRPIKARRFAAVNPAPRRGITPNDSNFDRRGPMFQLHTKTLQLYCPRQTLDLVQSASPPPILGVSLTLRAGSSANRKTQLQVPYPQPAALGRQFRSELWIHRPLPPRRGPKLAPNRRQ